LASFLRRPHLGVASFLGPLAAIDRFVVIGLVLSLMPLVMEGLDPVIEFVVHRTHHLAQLNRCSLLLVARAFAGLLLLCLLCHNLRI
jgi:hypothetical protein